MAEQPAITDVNTSDETVAAVRNEMKSAAGTGGVPIDRIPLNSQFENLVKSGIMTKMVGSTDRCIRIVEVPEKGGATTRYHCSRACVGVGGQKMCPEHDKSFFQPNQTAHGTKPRVFNSASISLSRSEMGDMKDVSAAAPGVITPAATGVQVVTGGVGITLSLEELADPALAVVLARKLTAALDEMPASNIKQMKIVVALQERIAAILEGGAQ